MLKVNSSLTRLDLSPFVLFVLRVFYCNLSSQNNRIGKIGASSISEALNVSSTLTELDLSLILFLFFVCFLHFSKDNSFGKESRQLLSRHSRGSLHISLQYSDFWTVLGSIVESVIIPIAFIVEPFFILCKKTESLNDALNKLGAAIFLFFVLVGVLVLLLVLFLARKGILPHFLFCLVFIALLYAFFSRNR